MARGAISESYQTRGSVLDNLGSLEKNIVCYKYVVIFKASGVDAGYQKGVAC